ncbi:phosphoethanolamine transferase EptA [Zophobihabitans entericus]|uniref:Phosphoethanolamine transferase EptA n=1 Tax=Zophobihabitans entericus TaxID=1635327 RepID=A0A6G9ICH5_9GAMM|nr:phosphoethanolamine transferase EptA [Zophobihabitans entericus]QIQ21931.1 phosphoethanolamine transferase EptA [Zophobihabitans entericus]
MNKIKAFLNRHQISSSLLIFLIAGYQATILNLAYYKQILLRLDIGIFNNALFFFTMPLVIFCVITIVLNFFIFPRLIKLVGMIFILVGAPLTYFMSTFSIMIDREMIQNVLDTNQAESAALLTPTLIGYIFFLGVIPAILVLLIKIKPVKNWGFYLLRRFISIALAVGVILIIAAFFYKDYAAFMRNNHGVIKYITPSNYIAATYNQYDYQKTKNLPFITIGEDVTKKPLPASEKKTLMFLVLGETSRAQNFSLNGYEKQTNPLLSQRQDIIYFKDTSSCGTATAYSLPCMFSNMPRVDYDGKLANRQSNVLDMLKQAQVNVLWRDNDGGCKGVCDRIEYEDMTAKNNPKYCQNGVCYDDTLFDGLEDKITTQSKQDNLIILHTIGSHGPTYYQRYPDEFKRFTPTCDTNEINNCDEQSLVNTYDNTIVYVDYIVNKTIEFAKQYQDEYNVVVMYMSDHGESLGENGIYLHSMPYSVAPEGQTTVPFLLWFSEGYQKQYALNNQCLEKLSQEKQFSQDNVFHSLLGIFNMDTSEYQKSLDILQTCQSIQE